MTTKFLTVNGYPVPVSSGSATGKFPRHADHSVSWAGRPELMAHGNTRENEIQTNQLHDDVADFLEHLFEGQGFHGRFDDDGSIGGLPPIPGSTFTVEKATLAGANPPRFGTGFLRVGGGDFIAWDSKLYAGNWSLFYWWQDGGDWVHRVESSTGAKWENGVRNDAAPSLHSIASGALTFNGQIEIDDLLLLPFAMEDEAPPQFYEWTDAALPYFWAPMEGDGADRRGGRAHVDATSFRGGKVGRAAFFTGAAGQKVSYPDSGTFWNWPAGGRSVSFLVRIEAAGAGSNYILWHKDPATNLDGWHVAATSFSSTTFRVQFVRERTGGLPFPVDFSALSEDLALGEWHAVSIVADDSGAVIYVDGVNRTLFSTAGNGSLSPAPAASPLVVGNADDGLNTIDGKVQQLWFFSRMQSANQAAEWAAPSFYRRVFMGDSPMYYPAMVFDGDLLNRSPIRALGASNGAGILAAGSKTDGTWKSNQRALTLSFEKIDVDELPRIPAPMVAWLLDRGLLEGASLRPMAGPFPGTVSGGVDFDPVGPFGGGASAEFFNNGDVINMGASATGQLTGLPRVTVAAWVRCSPGVSKTVMQAARAGPSTEKLHLKVDGGNQILVEANPGGGVQSFLATAVTVPDDDEFHLVTGIVDLVGDRISVWLDDFPNGEDPAAGFVDAVFDSAAFDFSIGCEVDGTNRFVGRIAAVYLWGRELSSGEIRRVYSLGRKGFFR